MAAEQREPSPRLQTPNSLISPLATEQPGRVALGQGAGSPQTPNMLPELLFRSELGTKAQDSMSEGSNLD